MDTNFWTPDAQTYLTNFLNMNTFDGALKGRLVECCLEEGRVVYEFPVQDWQNNEHKGLHGGITASIFDLSLGIVCSWLAGERGTTTLDLNITYISPGAMKDTLIVKAYVVKRGKQIFRMRGEALSKTNGKLIATATGTWYAL